MTSIATGVLLPAALRMNILSLQHTQSMIDQTQLRLATGLRVNSALDNPQNFFQARALNFRAASLATMLDGIGQSISTIRQSSAGVDSVLTLVQQAQSVANEALASVASQQAHIVGDKDLEDVSDLPAQVSGVDNGDRLVFSFIQPDNSVSAGNTVTISNGDSIDDLITAINGIQDTNSNQVFEAQLTNEGFLDIRDLNGNRFEIDFRTGGGAADSTLASALGFSDLTINELDDSNAVSRVTVSAAPSLVSVKLYATGGTPAAASTLLTDLTDTIGGSSGDIFDSQGADSINISVNGSTVQEVISDLNNETLQDLIDGINNAGSLNNLIDASFDASTGELSIRAISNTVRSIQIEIVETGAGGSARLNMALLGFGIQDLSPGNSGTSSESIELGAAAGALAEFEEQYNTFLKQIDALVADSVYQGINLLEGDDLTTFFNQDRSSSLITEGRNITYASLGISGANFGNNEKISAVIDNTDNAIDTLENFSSALSNDLSIIQVREDFTSDTIANLAEGADKLTIADQNEEGAKLIALQARQILGIEALSLGSLLQQSILRMFGSR